MKNILLLSSEFPPLPGGIGNHALHLALSLQKEGNNVTVVTNQRSAVIDEEKDFDAKLPFKVERISRKKVEIITYCNRIIKAFQSVRNSEMTTVLCSGKFSLWTGAFLKTFYSNKKYIAVLHGSEINAGGFLSKAITKWGMNQFDALIAVSHFTKNLALGKNKKLQITVINNGFSISKNENPNSDFVINGNPILVTVGNVTQRKGQQNVIKALPLLKETFPEIQYHMVGIPTEKSNFEELAKSLGVEENITFHNALSDQDLENVLSQSKVFMMLSDTLKNGDVEGFGIAVLEANALGIPAIGSKNSGIADAIQDGFSGKLVNPHDVNEIQLALNDIMYNYEIYAPNAKEWSTQFTWDIIVKKYLEIIE